MTPLLAPLLSAALLAASGGADLRVVPMDPDPVAAGGITTVHAFVANGGPQAAGEFTVVVRLPAGSRAVGPYFPAGCSVDGTATVVRCAFPAGMPALRSATALVPVRVADEASGTLRGGRVVVRSATDPDHANDSASFVIRVVR